MDSWLCNNNSIFPSVGVFRVLWFLCLRRIYCMPAPFKQVLALVYKSPTSSGRELSKCNGVWSTTMYLGSPVSLSTCCEHYITFYLLKSNTGNFQPCVNAPQMTVRTATGCSAHKTSNAIRLLGNWTIDHALLSITISHPLYQIVVRLLKQYQLHLPVSF